MPELLRTIKREDVRVVDGQQWDAMGYDTHGRFVSELGGLILTWLEPQSGERILDLGCGDGALTEEIAKSGAEVRGIDQSPDLIEAAGKRNLDVRQLDALALEDVELYDAVFSNAVLHWIDDWPKLFDLIAKSLRPQGRFVAECGGHGNIAAIRTAIMAAADHYDVPTMAAAERYMTVAATEALLDDAGFVIEKIELAARPTPLATGIEGWLSVFRHQFFDQFEDEPKRSEVMERVIKWLQPQLCDATGAWHADYVRLRFIAHLV